MLNEPPNRNSSDQPQRVILRIQSATPAVTVSLLLLCALIFLASLISRTNAAELMARAGVQGAAVLTQAEFYRLFSGLILVAQPIAPRAALGAVHALVSLYTLYIVGSSTEKLWGNLRFTLLYMLGGISGALLTLLFIPTGLIENDIYFAIAPNAILATLGGELVYLYKHRKLYARQGTLRQNYLLALLILNLIIGTFTARVDLFGMLGGVGSGALLGVFLSPFHLPRPHPDEPGALLGEDVNPLRTRVIPLVLYISGLMAILIVGVLVIGR